LVFAGIVAGVGAIGGIDRQAFEEAYLGMGQEQQQGLKGGREVFEEGDRAVPDGGGSGAGMGAEG
jgi:hypothetical protein